MLKKNLEQKNNNDNERDKTMIYSESDIYRNAYVELYELIKYLPDDEQKKIPQTLIENLREDMNNNYVFNIKKDEDITQQNFMTETKALFVELYEKYLAKDNEKEIWKEYDGFCFNLIENEKKEKYNYNDIFKNKKEKSEKTEILDDSKNNLPVEVKKEKILIRFIKIIKAFFEKIMKANG